MTEEAPVSRTERLLAMLLVQSGPSSQIEKCVQLKRAGIGNTEIGQLLGISASAVGTNLNTAKSRAKKKPAKKAAKKMEKNTAKKRGS